MDIVALINGIGINSTTSAYLNYSAVARTATNYAEWGGTITFDLSQTSGQTASAALAQVKVDAASQMGQAVPGNARIKVLGV